jgi:tRNA-specific 2-thiouridylase
LLVTRFLGDASVNGDWAWVRLDVCGATVTEAAGEGPGVAELLRTVRGRTVLEAAAVPGDALAVDALAAALGPAVRADPTPRRVAVAMSGGVDSAVALLRARESGLEPVGVTLRLWLDPAGPDAERACCSPGAVVAARELCHNLGIPHVTLDLRERFRRAIVRPFVSAYERGETPNPCVRCNGSFRFGELLRLAARVGAPRLATGHYARVVEHRGRRLLARASDRSKDQSYMLGRLAPEVLERLWFPLGEQTKAQTRAVARAAGLPAAERLESQEACFLAGGDYRDFLSRHGLPVAEGPVVDLAGRELGVHSGYWRFTPGQRRGLGVTSPSGPLYALATDAGRNTVVVGSREALARRLVSVSPATLHLPVERVEAKLRYRSPAVAARVRPLARGFELDLDEPFYGVAPGQAAVLYEDDAIVGAGLIAGACDAAPGE